MEGLADLLHAETEAQRKQALRQASGELSRLYEAWRAEIVRTLAHAEAVLEFGDEEEDAGDEVYHALGPRCVPGVSCLQRRTYAHSDVTPACLAPTPAAQY